MAEAFEVLHESVEYVPTENGQGQLGDDAEPPQVNDDQWPFLSSCDDREHFGAGATCWVTKQGVIVMISELRKNLTGVLIGRKTHFRRVNWTEYRRVDLTFQKACEELREWQAQTGKLDLEGVA